MHTYGALEYILLVLWDKSGGVKDKKDLLGHVSQFPFFFSILVLEIPSDGGTAIIFLQIVFHNKAHAQELSTLIPSSCSK